MQKIERIVKRSWKEKEEQVPLPWESFAGDVDPYNPDGNDSAGPRDKAAESRLRLISTPFTAGGPRPAADG